MKIGMVGLGRMGANMAHRLLRGGHEVVVFDVNKEAVQALVKEGAIGVESLAQLKDLLVPPRAAWLMLPLNVIPGVLDQLKDIFQSGDTLIDGGNSFYRDDITRAQTLREKGIHYIDVGTSGGIWGLERGYCLMIGGDKAVAEKLDPIFRTLAPGIGSIPRTPQRENFDAAAEQGYLYCGPNGAGHFTKMVHNGIEYGIMQAYAEGFALLRQAGKLDHGGKKFDFPLPDIAEVWRRGSVVASWLLDLTAEALAEDPSLETFSSKVDDTGEGRWTVDAAVEAAVPLPVITASLFARFQSRIENHFAERSISAMRNKFGGHQSKK